MKEQRGMAGPIVLLIIVVSLSIGLFFKYSMKTIDHPLEQVTEHVLSGHGIDIDFSSSKKRNLIERNNAR